MIVSQQDRNYRQCTLTVMDNIADPDIHFDKNGVCNYYYEYLEGQKQIVLTGKEGENKITQIAEKIKTDGKKSKYDCLIGLSGGVDSSYVALLVKKLGLRPLAVHMDNGWNSELAVKNIENIVTKLNIDLYTLVINWEEFRDIQLSYLKASVVDIEVVSDHAISATMYKLAKKYKIKYVISGSNFVTESIMPPTWIYQKLDFANLKDIHLKHGTLKLNSYPCYTFKKHLYYQVFLRLTSLSIIDYVPYVKSQIKELIKLELDWKDYGGKHYESIFTKFYQAFILPEKFKIDKRKAHLSNLICSGQMTKEEAMGELEKPLYSENELKKDKEYVLKKLGLNESEFNTIMISPIQRHQDYKSDKHLKEIYMSVLTKTQNLRKIFK